MSEKLKESFEAVIAIPAVAFALFALGIIVLEERLKFRKK